jgi:acetyltransferase
LAHPLRTLFQPTSLVVFGGSERKDSVGHHVLRNLIAGGYAGEIHVVNPKHSNVLGLTCHANLAAVGRRVELAVVATPASTVPSVIQECAEQGVSAAIVLSAGFAEAGPEGMARAEATMSVARRFGVRILGPNCLGLLSTGAALNATFANSTAVQGPLALVSQSGALCTAILDWASDVGVGFSHVVSVGEAIDVGIGEVLEYLAMDAATRAILVYVEGIRDGRRFMSGLRVAARLKPTVVLKAGKHERAVRAARSHTGALIGEDDVFDAALRRAGAVRANTIGQLFSSAQLLSKGLPAWGQNLCVITNAGGPGVMAADHAASAGVHLSELDAKTVSTLDACLPAHWSRQNPVDVLGDATPERYGEAVRECALDPNVDGLLVVLTPQAMTAPTECAQAVLDAPRAEKPLVTCWMGGQLVSGGRELFRRNGVPHFNTPESSVDAFAFLWAYHQNQRLLQEVSSPLPYEPSYDVAGARAILESALGKGRKLLSSLEAKALLNAFGIPSTTQIRVADATEALVAAESLGFPVVLKIDSPDITHKTDVGGVVTGLSSGEEVRRAFAKMMMEVQRRAPHAGVDHATVERMYTGKHGRELMLGVVQDPCFGPAISVGAGGTLVEILKDRSVNLPPLTTLAVEEMIQRTRVAPLLGEWRGSPAARRDKLEEVLLRLSDLVCELPEIAELDINPLVVDDVQALALDARVVLRSPSPGARPYSHMAIHPYPANLRTVEQLADGSDITLRPIRPEDAQIESNFVRSLSPEARSFRFMNSMNELTPEMLRRFTQIDYDREMAFIATVGQGATQAQIGVSRYVTNPDGASAEFALVVADDWHRKGVATRLMKALIGVARSRGLRTMEGEVMTENLPMLNLVQGLGFRIGSVPGDPAVRQVVKAL